MNQGIGNPIFSNERTYEGMNNLDTGFRLLALYRYWNMIYYFYPYKYLTDKNWNNVLKEYIPFFIKAKNRLEYELITSKLISDICDSHASLTGFNQLDSLKGTEQILVNTKFIENKLVVIESYTKNIELEKGDIITHIDKKPIKIILDSIKNYYSASNESAKLNYISDDLLRTNKNTIQIDYISSGKVEQKKMNTNTRDQWKFQKYRKKDTTNCYKFIKNNIGFITLKNIKDKDVPIIKKVFFNTKGIIIDIRNYPSISIPFSLAPYFVSKTIPFAKFSRGYVDNPGEFNFYSTYEIPKSKKHYRGKLVVLINEETLSAAEFAAMAFRVGDNTTIIGSQTAGSDGNVSEIILPGGLKTMISGIGVYYPNGQETQRLGIIPDVVVKPTVKGIKEGRDELLEKAIEIIEKDK